MHGFLAFQPLCMTDALPITTERCCTWLKAISRQDLVGEKLKNTFVCEKHFENNMLGHINRDNGLI